MKNIFGWTEITWTSDSSFKKRLDRTLFNVYQVFAF